MRPKVTTATAPSTALTAEDRCDRCGAQAYLRVELQSGGELLFCAHHAREHGDKLKEIAATRGRRDPQARTRRRARPPAPRSDARPARHRDGPGPRPGPSRFVPGAAVRGSPRGRPALPARRADLRALRLRRRGRLAAGQRLDDRADAQVGGAVDDPRARPRRRRLPDLGRPRLGGRRRRRQRRRYGVPLPRPRRRADGRRRPDLRGRRGAGAAGRRRRRRRAPVAARVGRHRCWPCRRSGWSRASPAREATAARRRHRLVDGLLAGLGFGVLFAALAQIPEESGFLPLALNQVIGAVLVAAIAIAIGAAWVPREPLALVGLVSGVLGATATALFLAATHRGYLTVAAVITSLYPAFTVVLAASCCASTCAATRRSARPVRRGRRPDRGVLTVSRRPRPAP